MIIIIHISKKSFSRTLMNLKNFERISHATKYICVDVSSGYVTLLKSCSCTSIFRDIFKSDTADFLYRFHVARKVLTDFRLFCNFPLIFSVFPL